MTKEEKNQSIEALVSVLEGTNIVYLTDTSGLDAETTSNLRRVCAKQGITLTVVKNTLLKKAMERSSKNFDELYGSLHGNTSIMIAEIGNAPARLIKDFRKGSMTKPMLKGAYIDEAVFIGENQLDTLATLKSREELIGDILMLLQSPAKNVISALQNGAGQKIAGLVKTLETRNA